VEERRKREYVHYKFVLLFCGFISRYTGYLPLSQGI
jgi:hypothetical protein